MSSYHLNHLEYLETEAIHVLREVAAEFERPVVCFRVAKIYLHFAFGGKGISAFGYSDAVFECGDGA